MAKFASGQSGNPEGCPKGAHHVGRPKSAVKELAKKRSLKILARLADIADGEPIERPVGVGDHVLKMSAPLKEQMKAAEIVLKVADELRPEIEINNTDAGGRLVFVFPEEKK